MYDHVSELILETLKKGDNDMQGDRRVEEVQQKNSLSLGKMALTKSQAGFLLRRIRSMLVAMDNIVLFLEEKQIKDDNLASNIAQVRINLAICLEEAIPRE